MSVIAQQEADIQIPAVTVDGALYPVGKWDAHLQALRHLAISVFIFDENGRLLIQRRAASKYHAPGLWANTCCTHPHFMAGKVESFADAADRRLQEELGFNVPLIQCRQLEYRADVGKGLTEWECVTLFVAHVQADDIVTALNPDEVSETSWANAQELHDMARDEPAAIAPWFRLYLDRFPTLAI